MMSSSRALGRERSAASRSLPSRARKKPWFARASTAPCSASRPSAARTGVRETSKARAISASRRWKPADHCFSAAQARIRFARAVWRLLGFRDVWRGSERSFIKTTPCAAALAELHYFFNENRTLSRPLVQSTSPSISERPPRSSREGRPSPNAVLRPRLRITQGDDSAENLEEFLGAIVSTEWLYSPA